MADRYAPEVLYRGPMESSPGRGPFHFYLISAVAWSEGTILEAHPGTWLQHPFVPPDPPSVGWAVQHRFWSFLLAHTIHSSGREKNNEEFASNVMPSRLMKVALVYAKCCLPCLCSPGMETCAACHSSNSRLCSRLHPSKAETRCSWWWRIPGVLEISKHEVREVLCTHA